MCINYMFPQDKKSYQHDFDIWDAAYELALRHVLSIHRLFFHG